MHESSTESIASVFIEFAVACFALQLSRRHAREERAAADRPLWSGPRPTDRPSRRGRPSAACAAWEMRTAPTSSCCASASRSAQFADLPDLDRPPVADRLTVARGDAHSHRTDHDSDVWTSCWGGWCSPSGRLPRAARAFWAHYSYPTMDPGFPCVGLVCAAALSRQPWAAERGAVAQIASHERLQSRSCRDRISGEITISEFRQTSTQLEPATASSKRESAAGSPPSLYSLPG